MHILYLPFIWIAFYFLHRLHKIWCHFRTMRMTTSSHSKKEHLWERWKIAWYASFTPNSTNSSPASVTARSISASSSSSSSATSTLTSTLFTLTYTTTLFCHTLYSYGIRSYHSMRIWFSPSPVVAVIGFVIVTVLLVYNLFAGFYVFFARLIEVVHTVSSLNAAAAAAMNGTSTTSTAAHHPSSFIHTPPPSSSITLLLPGVTLPWSKTGYLFIALLFAMVIHELGHALAAAAYGVKTNRLGLVLMCGILPAAFVELRETEQTQDEFEEELRIQDEEELRSAGESHDIDVRRGSGVIVLTDEYGESYHPDGTPLTPDDTESQQQQQHYNDFDGTGHYDENGDWITYGGGGGGGSQTGSQTISGTHTPHDDDFDENDYMYDVATGQLHLPQQEEEEEPASASSSTPVSPGSATPIDIESGTASPTTRHSRQSSSGYQQKRHHHHHHQHQSQHTKKKHHHKQPPKFALPFLRSVSFPSLTPHQKLVVMSAGIWHNLILCLICAAILFILPYTLLLSYTIVQHPGVVVAHVNPRISPALYSALPPGTVLTHIDSKPMLNARDDTKLYTTEYPNIGFCAPSSIVAGHTSLPFPVSAAPPQGRTLSQLEQLQLAHELDGQCCMPDMNGKTRTTCFTVHSDGEPLQWACLLPRQVFSTSTHTCDTSGRVSYSCPDYNNIAHTCVKLRLLDDHEKLWILNVKREDDHPSCVAQTRDEGLSSTARIFKSFSSSSYSPCLDTIFFVGTQKELSSSLSLTDNSLISSLEPRRWWAWMIRGIWFIPEWVERFARDFPRILDEVLRWIFALSASLALLNCAPLYGADGAHIVHQIMLLYQQGTLSSENTKRHMSLHQAERIVRVVLITGSSLFIGNLLLNFLLLIPLPTMT